MWRMLHVIFLERYYIDTTLLVGLYILCTTYMAAQCNAPLRSGRHTMMSGFINGMGFWGDIFYVINVVGGGVSDTYGIYGGAMQCAITFWETYNYGWIYKWLYVMVYIFYIQNVVGEVVNCKSLIYGVRTSLLLTS